MRERLVYLAYATGWALVRAMPERAARALFRAGADLAVRRRGKGVRRLESNLARVVGGPTPPELLRDAVRSYARYWLEVFRLPVMRPERVVGGTRTIDEERLRDAYAAGAGVIVALPHQGNWDQAGAWAALTGMRFTTVAERLRPVRLYDRFVAFRRSLGMEVLPLTGGERPAFEVLEERLRAGGMLCLVGDRDLTARGVEVEFFGEVAKFPAGPAALALRTGAPLLPATLWFEPDGTWGVRIHEAVPVPATGDLAARVRAMTQALAEAFEEGIRDHPADWHMLQRVFVADLEPRRAAA